jgi:hypothetical protein
VLSVPAKPFVHPNPPFDDDYFIDQGHAWVPASVLVGIQSFGGLLQHG